MFKGTRTFNNLEDAMAYCDNKESAGYTCRIEDNVHLQGHCDTGFRVHFSISREEYHRRGLANIPWAR